MTVASEAATFLIDNLFDLFLLALALRVLLQMVHADYFNPVVKLCVSLTRWAVRPFQIIIPQVYSIDLAILLVMLLVSIVKLYLLAAFDSIVWPNLIGAFLFGLVDILSKFITLWFFAIILRVIMSWFMPYRHHVLSTVLLQITEPLLRPARRIIPFIQGFDLSPIAVLIFLQLIRIILVNPLLSLATRAAFGT